MFPEDESTMAGVRWTGEGGRVTSTWHGAARAKLQVG